MNDPNEKPVTESTPEPVTETADLGYGHRDHQPDPNATYVFDSGPPRTLRIDPHKRWKLLG